MKNSPTPNMKQLLLILAAVALVGCGENRAISEWKEGQKARAKAAAAETKAKAAAEANATVTPKLEPSKAIPANITNPIVEKAIRKSLKKPTGELTKAHLEKVTRLILTFKQLTEVPKELENLTQLTNLQLPFNRLTDVKGLENLTQLKSLRLVGSQLTDVKRLEKLTKLEVLYLNDNPDLTKAQVVQLQKALPKCVILSNTKK